MQKLITENLNYGIDIVWSCCSMLGEIIDLFFFFVIFIKSIERKKREREREHYSFCIR